MTLRSLLTTALLFSATLLLKGQEPNQYSRKQVADDIKILMSNAADIHPNLYHDISSGELKRKTDSLISKLPDSLSVLSAYRAFAEATAFINEGNTSVDIPKAINTTIRSGTFNGIPLQVLGYDNNSFDTNLILPGLQKKQVVVTAINGEPSQAIMAKMVALKGDLASFRKVVAISNFRFFLSVIGIAQPYVINYKGDGGASKTITLNDISEKDYVAGSGSKPHTVPYTFTTINGQYGYINFRSMADYDQFSRFCDSVFKALDENKVEKLIIDLRENGGGNSSLGGYLLSYLTDKPYRMAGDSKRKVSQQFKDYLIANKALYGDNYNEYLKLPVGSFMPLGSGDLTKPENKLHYFKGRVCFLIGPYTFSSANMLAAAVKDYHLFTLIGEATGEEANHYGELCTIKLPNTGLLAFTSTTMWGRPNGNANDNGPIEPDHLVKRTNTTGDNVLDYAMRWLKK